MLHPDIIVRKSKIDGKGIFARKFIPIGMIVWIQTSKDVVYSKEQFKKFGKRRQKFIVKYAEQDKRDNFVLPADISRYTNHSCNPI